MSKVYVVHRVLDIEWEGIVYSRVQYVFKDLECAEEYCETNAKLRVLEYRPELKKDIVKYLLNENIRDEDYLWIEETHYMDDVNILNLGEELPLKEYYEKLD